MKFLRLAPSALVLALVSVASAFAVDIKPLPPHVDIRAAQVRVTVAPSHADWTYEVGETVKFTIRVTADSTDVADVPLHLEWGQEMMPGKTADVVVPTGGLEFEAGTLAEPGFLRLTASGEVGGKTYTGVATAALSPDKIKPTQTDPVDFDAFWATAKSDLAAVPLEAKLTLMPDSCTATVNVYHVALLLPGGSWQGPAKFYGILCEPVKPGKYPALLRVPGAGVRPYPGDLATAAKGVITFEVGIHGIPVNYAPEIYNNLLAGALKDYYFFNLDDRERFYYRRVIQGCLRSVDFLASRPNWNGEKLATFGGSQGGMLSIITASLDSRVTGLAAVHPAFSDVTGWLHGRAGGWPHMFRNGQNAQADKVKTTGYYDVVNFAKRLKVPGIYSWGYNDDICPPTSVYAAYNVITAPKQCSITLELAHANNDEQQAVLTAWLDRHLGVGAK